MKAADFRRIALSLPEATEGSHFGNPDFRVGNKIFATLALAREGYGVLLLTPEEQRATGVTPGLVRLAVGIPGGAGRQAVRIGSVHGNSPHRRGPKYPRTGDPNPGW